MSTSGQPPGSGTRPVDRVRILYEALEAAGAELAPQTIVRSALASAGITEIPEDDSFWGFARGALSHAIHETLGEFAGEAFDARIDTAIVVLSRIGHAPRQRVMTPAARPRSGKRS